MRPKLVHVEGVTHGWVRKKSHHVGVWKWRFLRIDVDTLYYWKVAPADASLQASSSSPSSIAGQVSGAASTEAFARTSRGAFSLIGCHASPISEVCFALQTPHLKYDEEFEAGSRKERDEWVVNLNNAAVRAGVAKLSSETTLEAGTSGCVVAQRFLRAKGLWEHFMDMPMIPTDDGEVAETRLEHLRCGQALLRLLDTSFKPRHGRLVNCQRSRALCGVREPKLAKSAETKVIAGPLRRAWLLLVSGKRLASDGAARGFRMRRGRGLVGPLQSSHNGQALDIDALHLFEDFDGTAAPFLSLALGKCAPLGPPELSGEGCGAELILELVDDLHTCRAEAHRGGCLTLVFATVVECEVWRRALESARLEARARLFGRRYTMEESLAEFGNCPLSWRRAMTRRLGEVLPDVAAVGKGIEGCAGRCASYVPRGVELRPGVALQRLLYACGQVCVEAEELLEAALGRRPLRRQVCEDAMSFALGPALATVGSFWNHCSNELSHLDGREILRWLDERVQVQHRLGAVLPAFVEARQRLAVALSLRMGSRLRCMVRQLLVQSLTASDAPPRAGGSGSGGSSARVRALATTLPVDLFMMISHCFHEHEFEVYRMTMQRVTKFLIREAQHVLWEWLLATREAMLQLLRATTGAQDFPPPVQQWLVLVAALGAATPALANQCRNLAAEPTATGCAEVLEAEAFATQLLGGDRFPEEWSLGMEANRFEALSEAVLWAVADVVTMQWRRHASTLTASACAGTLRQMLGGPMNVARRCMDPEQFDLLVRKVFDVCLGAYIVHIQVQWLAEGAGHGLPGDRVDPPICLWEEVDCFCGYFIDLSVQCESGLPSWNPGAVSRLVRERLLGTTDLAAVGRSTISLSNRNLTRTASPAFGRVSSALSERALPLLKMLNASEVAALTFAFEDIGSETNGGCDSAAKRSERAHRGAFRIGLKSLEGQLTQRYPAKLTRRASWPCSGSKVVLASEGGICDLAVSDIGAHGGFCTISVRSDSKTEGIGSLFVDTTERIVMVRRRRWTQLVREHVWELPRFEVWSRKPPQQSLSLDEVLSPRTPPPPRARSPYTLEGESLCSERGVRSEREVDSSEPARWQSASLGDLVGAHFIGTTQLSLEFSGDRRFDLVFDCPSHAFRWRVVLDAWWGMEVIPERPLPIIALEVARVREHPEDCIDSRGDDVWMSLPRSLTRDVLERALGGLWRDVQPRLQVANAPASNARPSICPRSPSGTRSNKWQQCQSLFWQEFYATGFV